LALITGGAFMSKNERMAALFLSGMIALAFSTTAFAQVMMPGAMSSEKTAGQITNKTLAENEKVQVVDVVAKPGDTSPMRSRPMRVIYIISGGTFERTYGDGTKEKIPEKAGSTKIINEPRPYALKNIGTTTIHLMEVNVK